MTIVIAPNFARTQDGWGRVDSVIVTTPDAKSLAAFLRRRGWPLTKRSERVQIFVTGGDAGELAEQQVMEWLDQQLAGQPDGAQSAL